MESRLGKYEIRAVLAHGATGAVYEAWDSDANRKVVIKTIELGGEAPADGVSPEAQRADLHGRLERFRREARITKGLQHPNILAVYDYGETEALAYTVLEYVDGMTLEARLQTAPAFSADDTVQIIADVLAALQYCHDRGIVHRDVKPASIVLTRRGTAKLTDFSLAYVQGKDLDQAGAVLGTPGYMSPEQFLGQPVDARSDIYATGATLFRMLTGVPPVDRGPAEIRGKLLHSEPPRPSFISPTVRPALNAVVMCALAKQPEARFSSAAAFAVALRGAACGATIVLARAGALPPGGLPDPEVGHARRRRIRSRARKRIEALLAMTLGGTAILFAGTYIDPHKPPGTVSLTPNPGQGAPAPLTEAPGVVAPIGQPRGAAPGAAPTTAPPAASSDPVPAEASSQSTTAHPSVNPHAPAESTPAAALPGAPAPAAEVQPAARSLPVLPPPAPVLSTAGPPTPSTGRAHMPAPANPLPLPPAPSGTVPGLQRRVAMTHEAA
jgi:serine/threonine-protein kinase